MDDRILLWLYLLSAGYSLLLINGHRERFPPRYVVMVLATGVAAGIGLFWPPGATAGFYAATVGFVLFMLLPVVLVRLARSAARRRRFGTAATLLGATRILFPADFLVPEHAAYRAAAQTDMSPETERLHRLIVGSTASEGIWRRAPASTALAASFVLIYLVAVILGHPTSIVTLLELGASYGPLVNHGEVFRLFTAMFLHIGLLHLSMNALAVLIVGAWVEPELGSWRTLLVFLFTGLAGNVLSHYLYGFGVQPPVSAGASGGAMGVFGAAFVVFLRAPPSPARSQRLNAVAVVVVATLFLGGVQQGIDNGAHLGGLGAGAILGFLLTGRKTIPEWVVRGVTLILVALTVGAFGFMISVRSEWKATEKFEEPGYSFVGPAFLTEESDETGTAFANRLFGSLIVSRVRASGDPGAVVRSVLKEERGQIPKGAKVKEEGLRKAGRFTEGSLRVSTRSGSLQIQVDTLPAAGPGDFYVLRFYLEEDDPRLQTLFVRRVLDSFRMDGSVRSPPGGR